MKIRSITTGISLESPMDHTSIQKAAKFNAKAQQELEAQGYEVQTTRISTQSFENYLPGYTLFEILDNSERLEDICHQFNLDFFNIGCAKNPEIISIIPAILKRTEKIFCSSTIGDFPNGINFESLQASAQTIHRISTETVNGLGNFRFCAGANCPPGIPFFPASYHEGNSAFSIGLECADLLTEAFSKSRTLVEAETNLTEIYAEHLINLEKIASKLAQEFHISYQGIDASIAPSLDKSNSIADAYETLGLGKFGHSGTLAISALITRVIKKIPVKLCGYSGLMLPVCEDIGLAKRASEGTYNLTDLLLYSSVCGCGLDTVPLPGNISVEQIEAILLDVASLAIKLDKPLSARLFPIPGKQAGEMTEFNSPYLVECKIFNPQPSMNQSR
ncbi:DUF711 family protein [Phormidium pseudopriestleyi FRX01]|uniref:DUF711 family protein n=1 Tax=Phormidium pseudopriestleyi FRX01 TaxID=1759528 RepID=A0ABS3FTQ4_9CYAN|nr:DUF711 family protein [Phormidium pseudopriestleyi]MBO0350504.1 DUF711 family protein [Phormidium pseudopriestleyi FRX01]